MKDYYTKGERRTIMICFILLGALIVATYAYVALVAYRSGLDACQPAQVKRVTIPPLPRP